MLSSDPPRKLERLRPSASSGDDLGESPKTFRLAEAPSCASILHSLLSPFYTPRRLRNGLNFHTTRRFSFPMITPGPDLKIIGRSSISPGLQKLPPTGSARWAEVLQCGAVYEKGVRRESGRRLGDDLDGIQRLKYKTRVSIVESK